MQSQFPRSPKQPTSKFPLKLLSKENVKNSSVANSWTDHQVILDVRERASFMLLFEEHFNAQAGQDHDAGGILHQTPPSPHALITISRFLRVKETVSQNR